jgi:hypothetical protein
MNDSLLPDPTRAAAAPAATPPALQEDAARGAAPEDAETVAAIAFDDVPLAMVAGQLAEVVSAAGELTDAELIERYRAAFQVVVPNHRADLLRRFAWSAKGHRFINRTPADTWVPGRQAPHPIAPLSTWTLTGVKERARELLATGLDEAVLFERLVGEVYEGARAPRLIASVVGKAIHEARQLDLS